MALGQLSRRRKRAPVPKLQITAMMDMFTIIMIFLLVSFSSRPERMSLEHGMELPRSQASMDTSKDVRLILSTTSLTLEGEVLNELHDTHITGMEPGDLKSTELYRRLRTYREAADVAPRDPEMPEKATPHLLFFCDKRLPFETINHVIKTAGLAGYPNLQFAVLEK